VDPSSIWDRFLVSSIAMLLSVLRREGGSHPPVHSWFG
jgi:hypothetical protein